MTRAFRVIRGGLVVARAREQEVAETVATFEAVTHRGEYVAVERDGVVLSDFLWNGDPAALLDDLAEDLPPARSAA